MDKSASVGWVTIHKEENEDKRKRKGCLLVGTLTRHNDVDGHIGRRRVCP